MTCKKCSAQLTPDNRFCPVCGARNRETSLNPKPNGAQPSAAAPQENKKHVFGKKRIALLALFAAVLTLVIGLSIFFIAQSKKVDFKNYVYTDIVAAADAPEGAQNTKALVLGGFDGSGKVLSHACDLVDWKKLLEEHPLSSGTSDHRMQAYEKYYSETSGPDEAMQRFHCALENTDKLKNGDTVTLTITWNDDYIKGTLGYTMKDKESFQYHYTVSGLKTSTVIDPFSMVETTVIGEYPFEKFTIKLTQKEKNFGDFTLKFTKTEDWFSDIIFHFQLLKGDKKIGEINLETITDMDQFNGGELLVQMTKKDISSATQYKYCFEYPDTKKTYPIEGLSETIKDNTKLTEKHVEKLKKAALDYWKEFGVEEGSVGDFVDVEVLCPPQEKPPEELFEETESILEPYTSCKLAVVYHYTDRSDNTAKYIYFDLSDAIILNNGDISISTLNIQYDVFDTHYEKEISFDLGDTYEIIGTYT